MVTVFLNYPLSKHSSSEQESLFDIHSPTEEILYQKTCPCVCKTCLFVKISVIYLKVLMRKCFAQGISTGWVCP